ncbi:MAG: hypothetical protein LBD16_09160 [Oscillospiraceae bacterium]|jgi:hypothetical protein|nr:hypothetical protein [Oscillospiraceae bacterium]
MIASIAMEQFALSHILNAEGEKLQKAIAIAATSEELININKSVTELVLEVSGIEEKLVRLLQDAMAICGCDIRPCREETNGEPCGDAEGQKRKPLSFGSARESAGFETSPEI